MRNLEKNNFKKSLLIVFLTLSFSLFSQAQSQDPVRTAPQNDQQLIREMYNTALRDPVAYRWLESLCLNIGHRLSGSPGAEKAVQWSKSMLDTMGLDSVWLQPVMVPHWVRGEEMVTVKGKNQSKAQRLSALALGGSVGTPANGISAPIVEINDWDVLDKLGEQGLKGKIVFYNRPMDPTYIRTFEAYGCAVDQRVHGASRAAKYGAIGVMVRSMALRIDDFPHTGTLRYDSTYPLIPAVAISTLAAENLSDLLKTNPDAVGSIKLGCKTLPDAPSFNVIGEIRGSEKPEEYILVGGHLDSWDVGHGAHDDGAGCVQSMEVLRLLKASGYKPKRTIRCVLFMNEENGLRGGRQYAAEAERKGEYHLCAIETDAGGFTPRGFGFEAEESVFQTFFEKVKALQPHFEPYGLVLTKGGSGADISPLRGMKGLLCGYSPDSQRYFDFHHTAADVFEAVHERELELGGASMAALVYLLDKYGL